MFSISVFPLHGWDIPSGADNSISHLYIQVNETNTILHFEDWQLFIWWRKKGDNVSLQCAMTCFISRERVSAALKQGIHSSMEEYGKVKRDV